MTEGTATTAVPTGLGTSAVELLSRLIRSDTVNPPGNEGPVQQFLKGMLENAGFDCELLGAEPDRPNLIARLRGDQDGPTLTLLGHVDTVRADPGDWSFDPWSGEVVDGWVRGRGALDMKGQVAAEVAACVALGGSGWRPPAGELLLVLTADEEAGGGLGAQWLCEQHPETVRSDFVVNEGDNALLKLAGYVAALAEQPPPEATPEGEALLEALLGQPYAGQEGIRAGLERLRSEQPLLSDYLVEPMLGVTLTPTIANAGRKANVIPAEAETLIDCRVPPGFGEDEARRQLVALIGEGDYAIEFTEAVIGNRSPMASPLADAISEWLSEADPGAELAPTVMPGFSDSNWFRTAFDDAVVYGFCPHREVGLLEAAPLIHGADERAPAADVELSAAFFHELPRRVLR
jgi:acetylornithine deacetylase/succinyl-diaminopimelate desuccinylase-like protein